MNNNDNQTFNSDSEDNNKHIKNDKDPIIITNTDFEFMFNPIKLNNPVELLENLYPVKYDEQITNEEKIKRVQKIMKEYME